MGISTSTDCNDDGQVLEYVESRLAYERLQPVVSYRYEYDEFGNIMRQAVCDRMSTCSEAVADTIVRYRYGCFL